ncbi:MAG: PAS domain-containing protein [Candidatus Omnitrophica bacterium]|nr:PAS domain-containing protein [Candidatus Omnitrophota bacterium]
MWDTFYLNTSTTDNLGIGLFKYGLSPEVRFITTNSTLAQILGYSSKEEIIWLKLDNLFFKNEDKDRFYEIVRSQGKVNFFEVMLRSKSEDPIWVAITASLVKEGWNKEYLEGIVEDISNHKKMEEELSLERDYMQGLLDHIPDAIYFKDLKNRIIKVNKFYAEGMKLPQGQIVGKSDFDFFPKEQAEKMFADDNYVLTTGKPIIGKIERTILPNGSWNQVITTKIPMYDKEGKVIGTMGVTRDMTVYANLERERMSMLINTLDVLGRALEQRDPYTFSHTRNVATIAEKIARTLGWDENRLLGMRLAGELHDLGKISIPLDILNKPGRLSDLEYGLVQEHVQNCYNLIKDMAFPFPLADIVYQHHERIDGSGYPNRLKDDKILPEARILAVSDVLESMTSFRPYREALGLDMAQAELKDGSGSRYEPRIVEAAIKLIQENGGKEFWTDASTQ